MAKQGYYYGLVKSQIGQDEEEKLNLKNQKNTSLLSLEKHSSRINYKDIQKQNDLIVEKEGVKYSKIFNLLKNNKCDVATGIISSLCAGAVMPMTGYVLSKVFVLVASGHHHKLWHESLIWCFIFLGIAFLNGFFIFLKICKLETLGSVITCNMRKQIVRKYLSLHLAYKLSIDTTQLNSIILTLVGDVLQTTGNLITGLVTGFVHDYRLTLISLGFIPFIIAALVMVKNSVLSPMRKKDNRTDIEASSILSEAVINTKTIFSFNFQRPVVEMYLSILFSESHKYISSALWSGFFMVLVHLLHIVVCNNDLCC